MRQSIQIPKFNFWKGIGLENIVFCNFYRASNSKGRQYSSQERQEVVWNLRSRFVRSIEAAKLM